MTVKELIEELKRCDPLAQVIIGNVRNAPFATYSIKEVIAGEIGPVYIRAKRSDSE